MRSLLATSLTRTAALLAPFVICGVLGHTPLPAHAQAGGAAIPQTLRVDPGQAVFSITPAGQWSFGVRGRGLLVESGSIAVYTTDEDGKLVECLGTTSGVKSLLPPGGVALVQEGAPSGTRYPSTRADDDDDGLVDEDPLDRVDNDRDGRIDEDFAAIGDAMAVVKFGPASTGGKVSVRQEVYAWSLSHIDRMVASTIVVRNISAASLKGVRVGVKVVPGEAIAGNRMLARSKQSQVSEFSSVSILLRGYEESLAILLFAPSSEETAQWDVRDDGETILAVSPVLSDIPSGETATLHLAVLAAPADETRTTRAVQSARRTVLGDGVARMIPPPVAVTPLTGADTAPGEDSPAADGAPAVDAFWLKPGKLDDVLLAGSPNPFRDAITIEYEIPTSTVDEDGVEHIFTGAAVPASVKVYNVTGRLIATLVEAAHAPGRYRTGWTAQNDLGGSVASGVYYVKLAIGKRSVTKRLVQIK